MKKIVSVFALGIAFIAGNQVVHAQDRSRDAAKEKVQKLHQMLDLNPKQEEIINRVYVAYEINSEVVKKSTKDKSDLQRDKIKNEKSLMTVMKETLTPEQFEKYLSFRKENMTEDEQKTMKLMETKQASKSVKMKSVKN